MTRKLPAALRERQQKGRPNPNRGKKFPVEVLTRREVAALIAACTSTRTGIRNRALVALLYRCGLRIAEALALCPKDVDLEVGAVSVLLGKGGVRRTVGLDAQTAQLLAAWLALRAGLTRWEDGEPLDDGDPVFVTLPGRPLSASAVRETLPRLARKAKVRKRVHAHGFRHTNAYELSTEGTPVPVIQRHLGHKRLATTEIYLNGFAPAQVIDATRGRRWTIETRPVAPTGGNDA